MPLNIDCSKKLVTKTERVKQIAIHPTETWAAVALYTGTLIIYDYVSGGTVKVFKVSEHPLRACRFIPTKKLVVCAGDDLTIRAFHYGNGKLVHEFEGHGDYIRSLAVCPNDTYMLSSSDDSMVKLWDIDDGFSLKTTYEGHSHYVMQVAWHPSGDLFASASLDKTIRVWAPSQLSHVNQPNFLLKGHEKSVNCVTFGHSQSHSNMLVSGGDDFVGVWDIHTKQLLHKLEGHTAPINAVVFHPVYPLILSAGEDNHIRLWNTNTYKKEEVMAFHMNRVWSLDVKGDGSCLLGIGADTGCAVVEMGKSNMIYSYHSGKILFCRHNRVYVSNLRTVQSSGDGEIEDGTIIDTAQKELGTTDMFAQSCLHHPTGRLVAICGENEFLVYTAQALRSKAFGTAQAFAWSTDGDYATLNEKNNPGNCAIQIYKDFKEYTLFRPGHSVDHIYGGRFLGVIGKETYSFSFHDWATGAIVRTFDVPNVTNIAWSPAGDVVAVVTDSFTYILAVCEEAFTGDEYDSEEGYFGAFETVGEIHDTITSLVWLAPGGEQSSSSLAFVTATNKLNIWIHGHLETLGFTGTPLTLVGYNEQEDVLILLDRRYNIVYYNCSQSWISYHLFILQNDFVSAEKIFPKIPQRYYDRIAKFLDSEGHKDKALEMTRDDDHKLSLALSLNNLTFAAEVLGDVKRKDPHCLTLNQQWKALGDAALASGSIELAASCFSEAKDYTSALLIHSSTGNKVEMERLAELAAAAGQVEVAIYTYIHMKADPEKVVDLYLKYDHPDKAAIFARTYKPSLIPKCIAAWGKKLGPRFKIETPVIQETVIHAQEPAYPVEAQEPAYPVETEEPVYPVEDTYPVEAEEAIASVEPEASEELIASVEPVAPVESFDQLEDAFDEEW